MEMINRKTVWTEEHIDINRISEDNRWRQDYRQCFRQDFWLWGGLFMRGIQGIPLPEFFFEIWPHY